MSHLSVIELPMLIQITVFILQNKEKKVSPSSIDCTVRLHNQVPWGVRFDNTK